MNNIKLNIISFNHPAEEITFSFRIEKMKYNFSGDRNDLLPDLTEHLDQTGRPSVDRLCGEPVYQDLTYEFTLHVIPKDPYNFIRHYYAFSN